MVLRGMLAVFFLLALDFLRYRIKKFDDWRGIRRRYRVLVEDLLQSCALVSSSYDRIQAICWWSALVICLYGLVVFSWRHLIFSLCLLVLPLGLLAVHFKASQKDRRREVRFLKRLFLLHGSLSPVSFEEVVSVLKEHAVYLRETILIIDRERKRNNNNLDEVYQDLRLHARDLEVQLFLDNLSQADRIHFKEGLHALETDMEIQQLIRTYQAERQKQQMEVAGIFCGLLLSFWLTYYLIYPWLSANTFSLF